MAATEDYLDNYFERNLASERQLGKNSSTLCKHLSQQNVNAQVLQSLRSITLLLGRFEESHEGRALVTKASDS